MGNSMMLQRRMLDFENSTAYKKLKNFYDTPSMLSLLGVSRIEDTHNKFIEWLLSPANAQNDHGLGSTPFRKFLETLALVSSSLEHSKGKLDEKLVQMILFDNYKVADITVNYEKQLNKESRLDIQIIATVTTDTKSHTLCIAIENKVKSKETKAQTTRYYKELSTEKNNWDYFIGVYLTPLLNRQYEELKEVECVEKKFIQLNYQYLADYVLIPCLDDASKASTKQYLSEYLLALRLPCSRKNGNFIMSFGREERELLAEFWKKYKLLLIETLAENDKLGPCATEKLVATLTKSKSATNTSPQDKEMLRLFWNKHESLLMTVLASLADSDALDNEARKAVADAVEIIKDTNAVINPSALHQVELGGEVKEGLKQRDLVNAVVLDYFKQNPNSSLADLQKAFPKHVQKKIEIVLDEPQAHLQNVDGNGKPRKQYHIIEHVKFANGKALAICNQWGVANIQNFLDHATQMGYQISTEEDF